MTLYNVCHVSNEIINLFGDFYNFEQKLKKEPIVELQWKLHQDHIAFCLINKEDLDIFSKKHALLAYKIKELSHPLLSREFSRLSKKYHRMLRNLIKNKVLEEFQHHYSKYTKASSLKRISKLAFHELDKFDEKHFEDKIIKNEDGSFQLEGIKQISPIIQAISLLKSLIKSDKGKHEELQSTLKKVEKLALYRSKQRMIHKFAKADKLKVYAFIYDLRCDIENDIKQLQIGESFVIPGGTTTHACIYKFTRTEKDKYNFTIYNTAGTKKYEKGDKIYPIKVADLTQETICEENFLESLIHNRIYSGNTMKDLLLDIKYFLIDQGGQLRKKRQSGIAFPSQMRGTCALSSLDMWLTETLDTKLMNKMKDLRTTHNIYLLAQAYKNCPGNTYKADLEQAQQLIKVLKIRDKQLQKA